MKASAAVFEERFIYDNEEIKPIADRLEFVSLNDTAKVSVYSSSHSIAASATDEVITLDEDANTKYTILYDADGVNSDSLSCKSNGDSDARAVKPLRILSGALSSLSVSNSDSSSPKRLLIYRIVSSSASNVEYISREVLI